MNAPWPTSQAHGCFHNNRSLSKAAKELTGWRDAGWVKPTSAAANMNLTFVFKGYTVLGLGFGVGEKACKGASATDVFRRH